MMCNLCNIKDNWLFLVVNALFVIFYGMQCMKNMGFVILLLVYVVCLSAGSRQLSTRLEFIAFLDKLFCLIIRVTI